ncbi:MAG: hypothetical protein IT326_06040, partial [Anaerolineae bacterium]|nr:hypothetical protein [Anaerolineae bacterium]
MPSEDLAQALDLAKSRVGNMQGRISFATQKDQMAELDGALAELAERLTVLRSRGYRYKNVLEAKLATLNQKWTASRPMLEQELAQAEARLTPGVSQLARKAAVL